MLIQTFVNDLLDVSMLAKGKFVMEAELFDVRETLSEVMTVFER